MRPLDCRLELAQGLVEYALLLIFIALAVIVALNILGGGIVNSVYNNIISNI